MIICPNLHLPDVAREFNEIKAATSEKAAYHIWSANNGNGIDKAPNGAQSKLFNDLLRLTNGNRKEAIRLKAKVYGNSFKEWFGDWQNDPENASKVVDENGEPLVVYHYTDNEGLTKFSTEFDNYFSKEGGTKKAIFFTTDNVVPGSEDNFLTSRKAKLSLFLNIKNLETFNGTKDDLHKQGTSYREVVNKSSEREGSENGIIFTGFDDNRKENQTIYIVHNSNQIKSATDNVGTFSRTDNNIYDKDAVDKMLGENADSELSSFVNTYVEQKMAEDPSVTLKQAVKDAVQQFQSQKYAKQIQSIQVRFQIVQLDSLFGKDISSLLASNQQVSSKDIITRLLLKDTVSPTNVWLANILQKHDVPVRLVPTLDNILCKAVSDENGGTAIILNSNVINGVSNQYLSDQILHEVIHAVTVDAINNPKTQEEIQFAKENKQMFELFDKLYPRESFNRLDVSGSYYILNNEKEFAAVFATDEDARNMLFVKAYQLDKAGNKTVLGHLKKFINAISKLFVNRNVFSTNVENLKKYQNDFTKYLLAKQPVKKGNITNKLLYDTIYNSINTNTLSNEQADQLYKELNFQLENFEQNNSFHIDNKDINLGKPDTSEDAINKLDQLSEKIARGLSQRLKAVMSSTLPQNQRSQIQKELNLQIAQFQQGSSTMYRSLITMLSQVTPQLLEDCKTLSKISQNNQAMNATDLQYQLHDNFGLYSNVLQDITETLQSQSVIEELLRQSKQSVLSKDVVFGDIDNIKSITETCKSICDKAEAALNNNIINSSKQILNDIGQETHSFTMAEYLDHLKSIGFDTAVFYKYGGMTDKVKDEGIRAITYLVNKAINTSQREEAKKRNQIAKAINGLSITEKVLDIYEKDERGRTTQYVIRDLNYGKFQNDYNQFLKQINKEISEKYGILLEPDNFQAPDERIEGVDKSGNKTDSHQEWNDRVNEWLDTHCNRKFKSEYYKAYSKLSSDTRNEWNDLQGQIRAIREKCKDKETGYYDYSKLTKEDQDLYTELNIQKRMLLSDRDYNGEMKVGDELRKARELQQLQKDLHPNKSKIRRDVEAWRSARDKVIEECGGLKELEKYNKGEENNFNYEKLKQWDRFNSKSVLKQDESGDILLYKQIEQEIGNIVYEVDGDGGAQYQEVKDQINNITRIYRDFSTGDISWNNVPQHEKIRLNKLVQLQSQLRKKAIAQNKTLKNLSNQRRKLFQKYTTTEYTESFNQLRKQALAAEAEDPGMYEMIMQQAYRMVFDSITGQEEPQLLRWFTKIVARPEYEDQFMDFIPGDGWIMSDDNNDLVNTEFDDTNPEKMQPKRFDKDGNVLYDNSKEFEKIQSSQSLKKLYDVTVQTIREINGLYGRENASDYLLPGIVGSMVKRVHHQRNKVGAFWDYVKDQFGIGNQSVQQDEDFQQDSNRILDSVDEFGNLLINKGLNISTNTRPDGHELNMIPRYYTLRLQDPSQLSADLGDILSTAHLAALKYKYKQDIKDKCETLSDMMERRSVMKRSLKSKFKLQEIKGSESNTYKISKKFLQMNLYNIRSGDTTFEMPWFGNKKIPIHLNKLGKLLGTTTVLVNLGCNFIVAATGFLSALFSHTVQAITGQQYSGKEGVKAARLVTYHIFKNILGANYIANRLSNDKLMLITEYFNIADQGERKLKHSNRNRFINGIADNVYFGMLSGFDFLIKSQIAVSTLLSFHYYDGEFCSFEDMIINTKDMSSKERKQAFKEWKKSINVYDILSAHDNSLEIDKEYLDAYNNVENVIHNRIIKYAESADGMMTETQKAQITTTFLGQMALLHRQYFPLMLQERFGNTVYDLDTQQVSGGIFRSGMKGMWYLTKALSKFLYGSAANMSVRQGYNYAKEYYDSKFNDKSSTANYIMSQTMKYQLKQVVAELALGQVVTFIAAYINNLAENERDKKKKMFLYLMSYLAHRVQWEVLTPYRFTDAFNTVKTPSAATGTIDKIENINESFWRTYFPTVYGNLYDTFNSQKKLNKYNPVVKTGVYTGWQKFQRDIFKFTPFHNTFEQLFGSDAKDRYYVNQVMKQNN